MSSFLKSALMLGLLGTGLSIAADKFAEQEDKDQFVQLHSSLEIVPSDKNNALGDDGTAEVPYNPYEDPRNYGEGHQDLFNSVSSEDL